MACPDATATLGHLEKPERLGILGIQGRLDTGLASQASWILDQQAVDTKGGKGQNGVFAPFSKLSTMLSRVVGAVP